MDLTGEHNILMPVKAVWEGLNDPEILKESIAGCSSLEKVSDTHFKAVVVQKIGPLKASFKGEVTLKDLNPPHSYRIEGSGSGGVAGLASGGADVTLEALPDGGTCLRYKADVKVAGKLAQLGGRLIESTAKKLSNEFFTHFSKALMKDQAGAESPETPEAPTPGGQAPTPQPEAAALKRDKSMLILCGIALVVALIAYFAK